jgi:hypothetical protein
MEQEAWPTPQTPARDPLPRVEDLPVAEQGYEQESVKAAFDSFYRHAAQLDAALRTLEAVDSFHRQASALRSDLRNLRSAGWTQQSWTAPPTYGYGVRTAREGISPVVWRIAGEVGFLVAVAVALGVAKLSWWAILLAMAGAFAIICLIEWLAGREQLTFARPATSASVHPVVEAQRAEDTEEDSLGWTAFEEAQEPSDAMTIIGAPPRDTDEAEPAAVEAEAEPEPAPEPEVQDEEASAEPLPEWEPEPEPEPEEPEPELPPAAEGRRRWWRRGGEDQPVDDAVDGSGPPSHVRVLPADELAEAADPWDEGFDAPIAAEAEELAGLEEPDEETEDPALVQDAGRRRFRRR